MGREISRRDFLKVSTVLGGATAVLAGCQNPRRWVVLEPYVRAPEEQLAGVPTWYASTCRQCPAGCGIMVRIMNGRAVKIEGNPEHPLNQGKLCARGESGLQVLYNPDRLAGPVRQAQRGSRNFQSISWEEGLNSLYSKLNVAGGNVAFWLGSTSSGHLFDLIQSFASAIGAPAPLVFDLYTGFHGYNPMQDVSNRYMGLDQLPAYELGDADVVFSFGADFLGTWLSATRYGIEFGLFRSQPLGKRGYLVQFEPRMSTTGAKADRWLPIKPGTEALVAQGLARLIADQGIGPAERVDRARQLAADVDPVKIAQATEIPADELVNLARIFAQTERPVAIPGISISNPEQASEAILAIQTLNLIAGAVAQPGGLLQTPAPPSGIAPKKIGSLGDVQQLIERMEAGQVQVLLVHGANPVYDLPDQAGFVKALANVPLVVSFAPIVDETAVWADLILPDRTYLESWGYEVVTPGFNVPVVSGQQPVVEPVYDNRSTADVILTIARGIPAAASVLPWGDEVAYLKETTSHLPPDAFGGADPEVRFARFQQHGGWWSSPVSGSSVSPSMPEKASPLTPLAFQGNEQEFPYFLYIFMSNLLSDGRGANQPWLQGSPETNTTISWQTWIELNPATAQKLGVHQGDILRVSSPYGEMESPVYIYPAIRPDTVAIPMGQGHTDYGRYARNRGSNPMSLLGFEKEGDSATWVMPRVKLTPTGKKMALATFENSAGVQEGFINQDLPGQ
jgi:anaerobic selenocysteine-containing dehydrogenase